eukprot:PITA_26779
MDDFTLYGSDFQEALSNLGKVLDKRIEMNLPLSSEKCEFFMNEQTVLGHAISQQGLWVDPNKIAIIQRVPPPQKVRDVRSFLGLAGYYRRFIKDFSKIAPPLFSLLGKDVEFIWYPRELVINQGNQFTSRRIEDLITHPKIKHRTSTPYHPQANGQVEVTNRALEGILTKVVSSSREDWADRLVEATWAYNTTWKTTTGFTPYELVYEKKTFLSIEFEFSTLRMTT